ncbi:hypothetical protein TRIUR3_01613 [Triticum urartu]|uniref:Uncharacterized protein n=1 Tax=Triticum urartu TaxID=4572 RepID=M7Z9B6_TRIUA|nr:hypothetical protein TRIUR3_01613 [Triticum urartu]
MCPHTLTGNEAPRMSGRIPLPQTGGEATPRSASPSPASSYTPPRRSLAGLMHPVAGTFASCLTQSLLIQQQQQKEEAAAPAAPCRFQPATAPSTHAPLGDPLQFNSLAAQYREDSLEVLPQILPPQPCLQGSCGRRQEALSNGCGAVPHCRFPSRSSSTGGEATHASLGGPKPTSLRNMSEILLPEPQFSTTLYTVISFGRVLPSRSSATDEMSVRLVKHYY